MAQKITIDKTYSDTVDRRPAGNRRLAQWRVTWLVEHSASHQLLWCIDSFVLRNPPLRQAPNRDQFITGTNIIEKTPLPDLMFFIENDVEGVSRRNGENSTLTI